MEYDRKKSLAEQKHEVILEHILDPEHSPLPEEYREQFNRIKSAALMLDSYPPAGVTSRLQAKYNISRNTARRDITYARELFKSRHAFDWEFWQQWQIKDLVETIRTCKLEGRQKERIAAHKVLRDIIGVKPESAEDPKRMEKNVFYIQLNNNHTTVQIPLEKLKGLAQSEIQTLVAAMTAPDTEDAEIVTLLDT